MSALRWARGQVPGGAGSPDALGRMTGGVRTGRQGQDGRLKAGPRGHGRLRRLRPLRGHRPEPVPRVVVLHGVQGEELLRITGAGRQEAEARGVTRPRCGTRRKTGATTGELQRGRARIRAKLRSSSGHPSATRESHTLWSAAREWSTFEGPSLFSGSCGEHGRAEEAPHGSIVDGGIPQPSPFTRSARDRRRPPGGTAGAAPPPGSHHEQRRDAHPLLLGQVRVPRGAGRDVVGGDHKVLEDHGEASVVPGEGENRGRRSGRACRRGLGERGTGGGLRTCPRLRGRAHMSGRPMAGAERLSVQLPTISAAPSQSARLRIQKPGSGKHRKRPPPSLHMSTIGSLVRSTKRMPSSCCKGN